MLSQSLIGWKSNSASSSRRVLWLVLPAIMLAACQPTVKVQAPDKPIEINLNVKVQQEVVVKLQRDAQDLIQNNPELFPQ